MLNRIQKQAVRQDNVHIYIATSDWTDGWIEDAVLFHVISQWATDHTITKSCRILFCSLRASALLMEADIMHMDIPGYRR